MAKKKQSYAKRRKAEQNELKRQRKVARREMIKAKVAVAKTQEKVNKVAASTDKAAGAMDAFARMERKADEMLDRANAMAELNTEPVDEAAALEAKYAADSSDAAVDDALAKLKAEMGL